MEELYSGSVDAPRVAIDGLGIVIVVWLYDETYTDKWSIWANRFELN